MRYVLEYFGKYYPRSGDLDPKCWIDSVSNPDALEMAEKFYSPEVARGYMEYFLNKNKTELKPYKDVRIVPVNYSIAVSCIFPFAQKDK